MQMEKTQRTRLPEILRMRERQLLQDWMKEQLTALRGMSAAVLKEEEIREECSEFLRLLASAAQDDGIGDLREERWRPLRDMLTRLSRSRSVRGFTPTETAIFVFSFKKPLFAAIREELSADAGTAVEEMWAASDLLDRLGLYTTEMHQKTREEVIGRQQQELLELSTPVVRLWEGILALPLIGTLDSARTQVVMESLLQKIVETGSSIAIIDITGVPTVDTLVAQHLLKTVTASRLMGADCIISGIRPQIAQTIVHLGVSLKDVTTKASLADAIRLALDRLGMRIVAGDHRRRRSEEHTSELQSP